MGPAAKSTTRCCNQGGSKAGGLTLISKSMCSALTVGRSSPKFHLEGFVHQEVAEFFEAKGTLHEKGPAGVDSDQDCFAALTFHKVSWDDSATLIVRPTKGCRHCSRIEPTSMSWRARGSLPRQSLRTLTKYRFCRIASSLLPHIERAGRCHHGIRYAIDCCCNRFERCESHSCTQYPARFPPHIKNRDRSSQRKPWWTCKLCEHPSRS